MKTLKVGISTHEKIKARTMAIARGELKPKPGDPKVWFSSVESFAKVLSLRNRELLALIATQKPKSLTELERLSGRKTSNLSRTLHTMERYGLVKLERGPRNAITPKTSYGHVKMDMDIMSV